MEMWNSTRIIELLSEQRREELRAELARPRIEQETAAGRRLFSLRRALASTLVRWGLRLDPTAGEGQGTLDLAHEGRQ